jgi:hypothetical protein
VRLIQRGSLCCVFCAVDIAGVCMIMVDGWGGVGLGLIAGPGGLVRLLGKPYMSGTGDYA